MISRPVQRSEKKQIKYQNQSKKFQQTGLIQIRNIIDPDLSSNNLPNLVKNLKIRLKTIYYLTVIHKRLDLQREIRQIFRLSKKILKKLFHQLKGRIFQEITK